MPTIFTPGVYKLFFLDNLWKLSCENLDIDEARKLEGSQKFWKYLQHVKIDFFFNFGKSVDFYSVWKFAKKQLTALTHPLPKGKCAK